MWRSAMAALVAWFPAHFLPGLLFDKKTQFWTYEAAWFLIFALSYMLVFYLTRPRVADLHKQA